MRIREGLIGLSFVVCFELCKESFKIFLVYFIK